jgi:hypothetical protein
MFGLILFFALFAYFVYNVVYMSKHEILGFWDGLYMLFCQGAEDFYYFVRKLIRK